MPAILRVPAQRQDVYAIRAAERSVIGQLPYALRVSELSELLSRLVAIDSVNPELIPGGAGEAEIAHFVAGWLQDAGLEVEVEEAAPGRPNVIGTARGSGGGRSLMLNAHIDTVGVAGMERPFDPVVKEGRLYGRGAYDMKASLAALLIAATRAHDVGLRGDLIVTAVSDEEVASVGTAAVARSRRADAAIVTEPTELGVAVAHKGFVAFEVETTGRAAHGSRPELGIDAISHMGHVLVGLDRLDRSLRARPGHGLLGTGSLHASLIEGGQEFSSYPARCVLKAERRTIPGETSAQIMQEVDEVLATAGAGVESFGAEARAEFDRDPFEVEEEEPIVELVKRHADATGVVGVPFWTDAALLAEAGIPTVVFGPCGEGAHGVVEWVDLGSAERCCDVLAAVATEFCA